MFNKPPCIDYAHGFVVLSALQAPTSEVTGAGVLGDRYWAIDHDFFQGVHSFFPFIWAVGTMPHNKSQKGA
jgi:hypothetical protein